MPKREDYISKRDMFMGMAYLASMRSKDPNTQVGAVIVSDIDGRVLSTGYNGFPNGCSDDEYPWEREGKSELDTKYFYVAHSELNAILNFRGDRKELENASLYVTLFPCHECAKAIIQSGIKRVYYDSDKYNGTNDNIASKRMLKSAGVEVIHYHLTKNIFIFQQMASGETDFASRALTNDRAIPEETSKEKFVPTVTVGSHEDKPFTVDGECPICRTKVQLRVSAEDTRDKLFIAHKCTNCGTTFPIFTNFLLWE